MIPVDQTRMFDPSGQSPPGNCFAACIASILEVPLETVPDQTRHFKPGERFGRSWGDYWDELMSWLRDRGWSYVEFEAAGLEAHPLNAWSIIVGPSPRFSGKHAVVGYGHEIKHDPHPSRDGLGDGDRTIGLFIAIDPSASLRLGGE